MITVPQAKLEGDERYGTEQVAETQPADESEWLRLARQAFNASESFMESSLRRQWERNLSNFRSRHPAGSKYHTDLYKHRSKLFRPKTRAMVRQHEATAAAALFATNDVVSIQPEDDSDPMQLDASRLMHELVNYRLTNSIPWYKICLGAYQDTHNHGVCISHQYWEYEERDKVEEIEVINPLTGMPILDDDGQPMTRQETSIEIVTDKPCIDLIPPENLYISPAANWVDPVNTSPYLIHLMPMYVIDVLDRMEKETTKVGEPVWRKVPRAQLLSGDKQSYDSTRQVREGREREDSKDNTQGEVLDYQTVWIHRNIIRREGRDWIYYTIGTTHLLSDPVPLEEVYLHGDRERPYVMGCSVIEAHRNYPSGTTELTQDLQANANDIANQRIDNVRLVMNKRYFIREGSRVDVKSLLRNVPGGVTQMMDPQTDVRVVETPDVTGSSYQEQDRINVDFDELAGQFSTGSVQSNRSLNETVGGMQLMEAGTGQVREYTLRTFIESWLEPVLRQIVRLEQKYETDETAIMVAGRKGNIQQMDAALFDYNLNVSVNVNMGATNPEQKIGRFITGINAMANLIPDIGAQLNREEIVQEIFGQLGYQNGKRFFLSLEPPEPQASPEMQKLELQAQESQQEIALKQQEAEAEMALDQRKLEQEMALEQQKLAMQRELKLLELQARQQDMATRRQEQASRQNEPQRNPSL